MSSFTPIRPTGGPPSPPGTPAAAGRPGASKSTAKPAPKPLFSSFGKSSTKPFTKKELVSLFRGLGSMLRAQINTADALKYYSHGLPNKPMVEALSKIGNDINAGMNIHEAFRRTGRFS